MNDNLHQRFVYDYHFYDNKLQTLSHIINDACSAVILFNSMIEFEKYYDKMVSLYFKLDPGLLTLKIRGTLHHHCPMIKSITNDYKSIYDINNPN